jgi:hypothetical protein
VNDTIAAKLGIGDDTVYATVGAPADFAAWLGDAGDAIRQHHLMPPLDVVLVFLGDVSDVAAGWATWSDAADPAGAVWLVVAKESRDALMRVVNKASGGRWADDKFIATQGGQVAVRFVKQKDTRPPWKR